jgi:hypothetical protein
VRSTKSKARNAPSKAFVMTAISSGPNVASRKKRLSGMTPPPTSRSPKLMVNLARQTHQATALYENTCLVLRI